MAAPSQTAAAISFTLEKINLPAISPELLLLWQQSDWIHVRQIHSMQVGPSSADLANQSDQDGRVGRSLGVGFYRGAIDGAFLKVIQTLPKNVT